MAIQKGKPKMIVTKIYCDRCGEEVKDPHSPRIKTETYVDGPKYSKGWKKGETIYLCEKCYGELVDFLNLDKEKTNGKEH